MAWKTTTTFSKNLVPWNGHDVDGALSLMTDDCIWEITRGAEPHGTLNSGSREVRTAIDDAFKAVPNITTRSAVTTAKTTWSWSCW
jgi:hypothetical protein